MNGVTIIVFLAVAPQLIIALTFPWRGLRLLNKWEIKVNKVNKLTSAEGVTTIYFV
jgi:hypothetical protein